MQKPEDDYYGKGGDYEDDGGLEFQQLEDSTQYQYNGYAH
jgi:hypothetical protein